MTQAARSPHVLLVEDNPGDVELLKLACAEIGFVCHLDVVDSVAKAISAITTSGDDGPPLDLVVLDLNLPAISGVEVLRWCQASTRFAALPVVVLTSSQQASERDLCLSLGALQVARKAAVWDGFLNTAAELRTLITTDAYHQRRQVHQRTSVSARPA